MDSSIYQQSSVPLGDPEICEKYFACYPVRQLDAEVLADAICTITGSTEEYSSAVPEPFTFIPAQNRSIELADGSITSQFLEMFGRPSRDTGLLCERDNEPSAAQRRELLNSTHIQGKLEKNTRLNNWMRNARNRPAELAKIVYLNVLSRYPTESELEAIAEYRKTTRLNMRQTAVDLTWALVNSKEFLYKH
ncbi:MAG: homeobox domain-containing protein [Planctomycetaceae bacterium]|nr:homeobox domain-containing protein [Planctomycetaceae bacterium]